MTDGIIQQVFNEYRNDVSDLKIINLTILIEQELIEKIKQYELLCYKDNRQPTTYIPKIRLIGDNQE